MKAIKTLFFAFTLTLLGLTSVLAKTAPPAPGVAAKSSGTNADDPGHGNPGLPIDQNLVFLAVGGMVLGITVLYKNKIKKASI